MYHWFVPEIESGFAFNSTPITFGEVFSIYFMQPWVLLKASTRARSASPWFSMYCAIISSVTFPEVAENNREPTD
jgi:hypothetical protein